MNINVLLGTVAFVVWSAFSTWYYVNYIKQFDQPASEQQIVQAKVEGTTEEFVITDSTLTEAPPAPFEVSRDFSFHKNTTDLADPGKWNQFKDSVNAAIQGRDVIVSITGFTCDLGNEAYNLSLGEQRAQYLSTSFKSSNASLSSIVTKSAGEKEPLLPNTSEDNRARNRRATITIKTQL